MIELELADHSGNVIEVNLLGRIASRQNAQEDQLVKLLGPGAYSCRVIFNMSKSEFMDSSGIGWLLSTNRHFQEHQGQLVIFQVPPLIMRVLHTMQLERVLSIADTREQAVQLAQGEHHG